MPTFGTSAGHDALWSGSGGSPVFVTGSVSVRNAVTTTVLGTVTLGSNGTWSYTSGAGIDFIDLNNGGTWVGPFASREFTLGVLASAVSLATATPLGDSATGTAGTGNTAARDDHQHKINAPHLYPIPAGTVGGSATFRASPNGQQNGSAIASGSVKAPMTELFVPRPFTLTALSVFVATASVGGSGLLKMSIYASDTRGAAAGAPVWTSASVSSTTTGRKDFDSLSVGLSTPGLYHLVFGSYAFSTSRAVPARGSAQSGINAGLSGANGQTPAPTMSNFDESTGAFPSTPTFTTFNDGTAFWFAFNGDPI